jgi:serine/threonine protein kinase
VNKVVPQEDRLGPYRLLLSLGKGGMAEVWKAEHRHLGQLRALKVLLPEVAARSDLVSRLLTEARATARLRHPAIVEVFDCDLLDTGGAFIAMEYLRGEHLRAWLDRAGNLARQAPLAAAILGVLADGLAYAHQQGVVHRDLKPENIFLVPLAPGALPFGVKILDFGIAKLLREQSPTKTRPDCVMGTPLYMAPEQWQPGETIDHRADVYALGCVFFEILTGRPPFAYGDDLAMMRAHLMQPAPLVTSVEPSVPQPLARLLSAMLAKDPEDRPATMEVVIVAVEQFLGVSRAGFPQRLQAPVGQPVRPEMPSEQRLFAVDLSSTRDNEGWPVRRSPPTPTALANHGDEAIGRRRRLLSRVPLTVVGALAVCGLGLFAIWVVFGGGRGGEPAGAATGTASAGPRPAASVPAGADPAGPRPAEALRSFIVALASRPVGAEVWVDGERQPRGRTPLDLVFASPGARSLRLAAPGFRSQVLTVVAGEQTAATAVLVPEEVSPPAARRRTNRPAVRPPAPYRAVGD